MRRPTINISPAERVGRILIGAVGFVGGLALLASGASAGIAVLEVLLALAGLDLIVTGALGHCPLYAKLGHTPRSLTRRPA
jgi:hypothetical protein